MNSIQDRFMTPFKQGHSTLPITVCVSGYF